MRIFTKTKPVTPFLCMLGVIAMLAVACKKEKVTGVEIISNSDAQYVEINKAIRIYAKVLPQDAENRKVTWASSNERVASIDDNGLLQPIALGETLLTCTTDEGGFTDELRVIVIENYGPKLAGDYFGTLVLDDTLSYKDFFVLVQSSGPGNQARLRLTPFAYNNKYLSISCLADVTFENNKYRIHREESFEGYPMMIDGYLYQTDSLQLTIQYQTPNPIHYVFFGKRGVVAP